MTLIGLTGFARSGKDSVGSILVQEGFTRFAFADRVKDLALAIDPLITCAGPISVQHLSQVVTEKGWEEAKGNPEVRRTLIKVGEGARIIFGDNIWVDDLERACSSLDPRPLVVTDVRYENEAEYIRSLGGQIWLVHRPGTSPAGPHDRVEGPYDVRIANYGTLDNLVETTLAHLRFHCRR